MSIRKPVFWALTSVIFLTLPAQAAMQPLHDVEHAAYVYALSQAREIHANPQISLTPLDKRLRLQACDVPLEAFSNRDRAMAGQITVGIRCLSPVSWTVYVSARVRVMHPVVVVTQPLSANHVITEVDVRVESRDIASLRQGYLEQTAPLVGQTLRNAVAAGSILQQNQLRQQMMVRRGEHIILIAGVGGMEVRMGGTALADAGIGERIRVKNNSSERVVEGIVAAEGIVRINL